MQQQRPSAKPFERPSSATRFGADPMGEPAGNGCVVDRTSARYQSNQRRHRDRLPRMACAEDLISVSEGEHSNDFQPRLTQLGSMRVLMPCSGEASKNGPIVGQPPLFNPIKLKLRCRPTGSGNFSRPSTLAPVFRVPDCAAYIRPSVGESLQARWASFPRTRCRWRRERLRGRETAIDSETFETPMCYPPLGCRMKAESYSRA
jgi:hypothetical protein